MASLATAPSAILPVALVAPLGYAASSSQLTADQAKILESARESALAYTQRLPNFICTQVTHRDAAGLSHSGAGNATVTGTGIAPVLAFSPDSSDVIEERLTYFAQKEHYEAITINGKKATGVGHLDNQGAISAGEFGSGLHDIFDPQSHTEFSWGRTEKMRGRTVYIFAFHVPKESGAVVTYPKPDQQIVVPYAGLVFIDADTRDVMRTTSRLELPAKFPIQMAERMVDYIPAAIAGRTYNLPSHSEVRMQDGSYLYSNKIDFKNYQKFTAESTIHYGSSADQ
jgi:hypothetical protein